MSKFFIALWSIYLLSFALVAEEIVPNTSRCDGNMNFNGIFVDITCSRGFCQGQVPSQDIHIEGNCAGEINYTADGTIPPFFVSGSCNNGELSFNYNSQSIALYGDCIFEDNYYASFSSYINSSFGQASGFCQTNGMSRIFLNGGIRSFLGQCRKQ